MKQRKRVRAVRIITVALCGLCTYARADVTFNMTFDTRALVNPPGSLAMPFELAVVLIDGGNGPSTAVTLDQFDLGGGLPGPLNDSAGGAGGSIETGIQVSDSSFFNLFAQTFSPGNDLAFRFHSTANVTPDATPDELDLLILAGGLTNSACGAIPTTDPRGTCALLRVTFDSESNPLVETFSGTGDFATVGVESVPEPSVTVAIFCALAIIAGLSWRRRISR